MDLTVVIAAYNEEARLGAQLDALLAQEWDGQWEVIVVDNGSTDGTAALVESYAQRSERLTLLKASERPDQCYAAKAGLAKAKAAAVAFCDADDVVAPGWVAAMGRGLAEHEVVTGPNELDLLNPAWLASSRGRSGDASVGTFVGIFPTVRGNNFGVRSSVWERTGPLVEGWKACHDIEFSLRCWLHGIEIVGLPDAVEHYRYRTSAKDLWRQGWNYGSHRPRIARLLREAGKPVPPPFSGWKSWVLMVLTVPKVVTRRGRASWLWVAANRFGQVAGSWQNRVVML